MGCFLGCFGGAKDHKSEKRRNHRDSPQWQRHRVPNAIIVEQLITAPSSNKLVPALLDKPHGLEQWSPSSKKTGRFDAHIITYKHEPVLESTQSLQEFASNIQEEKKEDAKTSSQSHSISEDDNSVTSSVGSYPPNHSYHYARDSDDEAEKYGDSDLDNMEDDVDGDDEYINVRIVGQEVCSESVLTALMESKARNFL